MEIIILILPVCVLTPDMNYGYNIWLHTKVHTN